MVNDTYSEIHKDLKSKYKKQVLSIQEVAKEIGISTSSLRNGIKLGQNIPSYRKVGHGTERIKVIFPIHEVAKYLANLQQIF